MLGQGWNLGHNIHTETLNGNHELQSLVVVCIQQAVFINITWTRPYLFNGVYCKDQEMGVIVRGKLLKH